jgi:hypothetical protein
VLLFIGVTIATPTLRTDTCSYQAIPF